MSLQELAPHHELFIKAYRHNWDRGLAPLKKILADEHCDRGTAQLIYWLGHPEFYNQFEPDEIPDHAAPVFKLLVLIEERFDDYPDLIALDPSTDFDIKVPAVLGRIPDKFVVPTTGDVSGTDLAEGRYGKQLLIHAAREGDIAMIRQAIADGLDPDAKIGREYLLVWASIAGHADIVNLLAEHSVNLKRKTGGSGFTALHWASQSKRESVIDALLSHGVSIDIKGKWGRTALHNAVYWEPDSWLNAKMDVQVEYLLRKGANPLAKDSDKKTPIDQAETIGNSNAVALLKAALGE